MPGLHYFWFNNKYVHIKSTNFPILLITWFYIWMLQNENSYYFQLPETILAHSFVIYLAEWSKLTEWAVLCSSNRHLCLTDNHADATKLKVFPKNPRIPKSHALELHCESQCDSHLKHSLKLSWSKDGEPFEINGTEDGRWVHCCEWALGCGWVADFTLEKNKVLKLFTLH